MIEIDNINTVYEIGLCRNKINLDYRALTNGILIQALRIITVYIIET